MTPSLPYTRLLANSCNFRQWSIRTLTQLGHYAQPDESLWINLLTESISCRFKPELLSLEANGDQLILNREYFLLLCSKFISPRLQMHYTSHWYAILEWVSAPPSDPEFSPLLYVTHEGLPPVYIQVCGLDPLRDEGLLYEKCFKEDGVGTKLDVLVPSIIFTQVSHTDYVLGIRGYRMHLCMHSRISMPRRNLMQMSRKASNGYSDTSHPKCRSTGLYHVWILESIS